MAFALAAQTKLQVCATDVSIAFLYGLTREKVCIKAGPEFGDLEGHILIFHKSCYGLKSSAARFHKHMSTTLRKLAWKPSKADSDLWIKPTPTGYKYLATYVDDILVWSKDPMKTINAIQKTYKLKGIGYPEYYLGGDVLTLQEKHLTEQNVVLALSAKTYIKNSLDKLAAMFNRGPFSKASIPMQEQYHPEADESPLLDALNGSKYQALIGSANWIVML